MSSTATKSVRFVTVTCACGASFEREVKRGRPQVWCPACVAVPFYERSRTEVPTVTTAEGVEIVVKPVNENDPLGQVRDQVEAAMVEVNEAYKAQVAAAVEAGQDRFAAADAFRSEFNDAVKAVYMKFRGF